MAVRGGSRRRLLPWALGEPLLDHRQPIAAPKRLAVDEDPGRAEHPAGDRLFALLARDDLHLGIGDTRQHHIPVDPQRGRRGGDGVGIVGIEAVLEVADDDALCQGGGGMRILSLEMIKGADRRQSRPWMIFRQAERDALEPCEAIPVAARIFALERRAAQPLRARDFERGAERKRPPRDGPPVALGKRLDFERGKIGIARSKVEPELDWRPAALPRFAHFPSPRDLRVIIVTVANPDRRACLAPPWPRPNQRLSRTLHDSIKLVVHLENGIPGLAITSPVTRAAHAGADLKNSSTASL